MAWEGFSAAVNDYVTRDLQLMSWENFYQTTPSLLDAGFTIVNSSWIPMYIVTPVAYWSPEEVFNWDIYSWRPMHPGSPYKDRTLRVEDKNPRVIGGQLLAWGDAIAANCPNLADGIAAERELVAERAPMLAENTWNRQKRRDYADVRAAYQTTDRIRKEITE